MPTNLLSIDPRNWLVMYNLGDADSLAWVEAYREARAVPYANLLGLRNLPADETIDEATWLAIADAVRGYIARNRMAHIRGILLGHRLPAVVQIDGQRYALSSLLANLKGGTLCAMNPYYTAGLVTAGDLPKRATLMGGQRYLVSEMTAPSLDEAVSFTARAEALSTVAADGALLSNLTASNDLLHAPDSAGAWPGLDAWRNSIERDRCCLPTNDDDPAMLGQAICLTSSDVGSFDSPGQTRGLFVSVAPSVGAAVRDDVSLLRDAVTAGYSFALAAVDTPAADDLPNPAALLAALRAGGTWAEALAMALPTMATCWRAIGDPLWGMPLPRAGVGVYCADNGSLVSTAPALPDAETPIAGRLPQGQWQLHLHQSDRFGTKSAPLRRDVFAGSDGSVIPAMRGVQSARAVAEANGCVRLHWAIDPPRFGRVLPDRFEIADADEPQTILTTTPASNRDQVYSALLGPFAHGRSVSLIVRPVRDAQNTPAPWAAARAVLVRAAGPAAPSIIA